MTVPIESGRAVAAEGSAPPRGRSPRRLGGARWIVKRLASGALVLLAVTILVFLATHVLPGDTARAILGRQATPELIAQLRERLGLDRPLLIQYFSWLWDLLRGDFGVSLASGRPVIDAMRSRLLNSIALLATAGGLMIPFSVATGVLMAIKRGSRIERVLNMIVLAIMALPDFVIGTVLVIVFATTVLPILPSVSIILLGESAFDHPDELVLPVLTGLLITAPFLIRQIRASMIEVLESDYIVQARLQGVSEGRLIWRQALVNALVPMIQGSALMLSYLLGGVVVIEYIFNYPGLGSMLTDAVRYRDLPVLQSVTLVFTAGVVLFNFVADLLTIYVTPRLRTSGGSR